MKRIRFIDFGSSSISIFMNKSIDRSTVVHKLWKLGSVSFTWNQIEYRPADPYLSFILTSILRREIESRRRKEQGLFGRIISFSRELFGIPTLD